MSDLIYYPGFSLKNETWAKFALLYIDRLKPIVPKHLALDPNANVLYNDLTNIVRGETTLVSPYPVRESDADRASRRAIKLLELYFRYPELLTRAMYGVDFAGDRILDSWRNPQNCDTVLFRAKYIAAFWSFCSDNKIGVLCDEGMKIPRQLSNIYMSMLADVISNNTKMEMITDDSMCNNILLHSEELVQHANDEALEIAQFEINYALPSDLEAIPLSRIIAIRNDKDFNTMRQAFSDCVRRFIKCREGCENCEEECSDRGKPPHSIDNLLYSQKHLRDFLKTSFGNLIEIGSACYSCVPVVDGLQDGEWGGVAFGALAGIKSTAGLLQNIRGLVREENNHRMARKYLATLSDINNPKRNKRFC